MSGDAGTAGPTPGRSSLLHSSWDAPDAVARRYGLHVRRSYRIALVADGAILVVGSLLPWYEAHHWRIVSHTTHGVPIGVLAFFGWRLTLGVAYVPWGVVTLLCGLGLMVAASRLPSDRRAYGLTAAALGALASVASAFAMGQMATSLYNDLHAPASGCGGQVSCPADVLQYPFRQAFLVGIYVATAAALAAVVVGVFHAAQWRPGHAGEGPATPTARLEAEVPTATVRRRAVVVLVCAVISAMIVAAGNGLSSNANPQGHAVPFQSGYLSCCDASEVGASWVVPRLLPPAATSVGREAAWIGAQTGSSFFVQIGTIEEHAERGSTYEAFWSDLQVSELPITIPHALRPGDEVLAVLRREPTRWVAQLRDVTRRWTFTRRIPSSAAAQLGEWLDEDIVATALGPPTEQDQVLPMLPTDRALRFRHLTLDGLPPGQLTASGFIDDTGHALVPVRDGGGDGFTVVRRAGA